MRKMNESGGKVRHATFLVIFLNRKKEKERRQKKIFELKSKGEGRREGKKIRKVRNNRVSPGLADKLEFSF